MFFCFYAPKSPMFKRDGDTEVPEPFAEMAKFFTESRLLQQDVKLLIEGVSNQLVMATIIHPVSYGEHVWESFVTSIIIIYVHECLLYTRKMHTVACSLVEGHKMRYLWRVPQIGQLQQQLRLSAVEEQRTYHGSHHQQPRKEQSELAGLGRAVLCRLL